MKHLTSYIFLIIAFLLLGVNGVAAQEKDCPFKVAVVGDNTDISYDNKVLSIRSSDKVTITGDGSLTDWGIEIESRGRLVVTIEDLNIEREGVPLKIKRRVNFSIIIEGTNRFVSKGSSGTAGIEVESSISLRGGGSLTAIGANGDGKTPGGAGIGGDGGSLIIEGGIIHAEGGAGAPGIGSDGTSLIIQGGIIHAKGGAGAPGIGVSDPKKDMTIQIFGGTVTAIGKNTAPGIDGGASSNYPSIAGNAFVIAIDGTDDKGENPATTQINNHTNGLFILGQQQPDNSIVWDSSALVGDVTLESNAEIPDWAEVTIADGQTFTIADGITLVNNGTLTNNGAFTNNGTLSGTVAGVGSLNIGGKEGFDVFNTDGGATFSYNGTEEVLTISRSGYVLIRGRNKDKAVGCGIVIEQSANIRLTLEDLNIKADKALEYGDGSPGINIEYGLTLQGTNRLTSTSGPGMNLYNNNLTFIGSGSLTVTGGNGYAGIEASPFWLHQNSNVFVVAIGGEGAASGISGHFNHNGGLLIHGSQDGGGNFSEEYSKLVGNDFTLGGDAEIPKGATVTIADNQTFTIDAGVTLTNNGTIVNNGIIRNKGTLKGNSVEGTGKLYNVITFNANYSASPVLVEKDFLQGDALPSDIFTRSGYTFQGWYDALDGGTKVETATEPQTLYARWKAVPVPEPEPEPAPTIYYTVTLPFVEGAATDPVAGDYDVESWSTFRFYLTLDTAYSESEPVITTSRGETLVPRTSDGAYLVKYVRTDVEIFIDGIEKNNPVANEPIRTATPEPEIWSEDACLCIRLPEGLPTSPVRIFTAEGRLLDSFRSTPGLNRRQLPTGIYIVQVGATVRKVAIR